MVDVGEGVSIHVARAGADPAKPFMLFVHGFPEFWGSWRHQIKEFRDTYDVAAMDMRGFGQSSKPAGINSYGMDKVTADMAAVIRKLGCERRAVLVAHDWGGSVCWAVAHAYPELVGRLVIACAPHPRAFAKNFDFNQFLRSWYMFLFQMPFLP